MPVLSRIQRNAIHAQATQLGLSDQECDWITKQKRDGEEDVFTHRPTESRMSFSFSYEKFWLEWWPAFQTPERYGSMPSWDAVLQHTYAWLDYVKANHDAPDLWAEARKTKEITDAAGHAEENNTPFDLAEIELLKPRLDVIEAYIVSRQPLAEEQRLIIRGRFSYLLDAASRKIGRIDWLNIFVSQIVQLFTDGVVSSSLYGDVMRHAAAALSGVWRFGSRLLSP
jgi:hypothetical protein